MFKMWKNLSPFNGMIKTLNILAHKRQLSTHVIEQKIRSDSKHGDFGKLDKKSMNVTRGNCFKCITYSGIPLQPTLPNQESC